MGTMPVTLLFSDYRTVAGIKSPFTIEQKLSIANGIITVSEMTYDVAIGDAKFAKPQ